MTQPDTQAPLGFAVIGCGVLARSQHLPNIVASDAMRLVVCCDRDHETLQRCQHDFAPQRVSDDFHEAIRDPEVDVICLAATEKLRLPVIQAAADAGKPVYVEKPLARSLEEMLAIGRVVREAGIPFCVGHNRRSAPAMRAAHAIFRRHMTDPHPCLWRFDREGDQRPRFEHDGVAAMAVRINDDWHSWKNWVFDPQQAPHGPMLFEMTHFTDLCNWFLDAQPLEVVALEQQHFASGVIIRYRTGELATIMMSANGTFGYPKELYEMMGQGGLVAVEHMLEVRTAGIADAPPRQTFAMLKDRHPHIGSEGGFAGWWAKRQAACAQATAAGDPMQAFTAEPDRGHAHALARFVEEIRGQGPVVCGVTDAILATRVAFAAIRSAQERRVVTMAEIADLPPV